MVVFFFFFKSVLVRSDVSYLIFHLLFLLKDKNISHTFFVFLDIFIVTINFTMFICGTIKKPPLHLQHSSTQNQLNTTHKKNPIMEQYLNILEETQPVPEEPIIGEQKLCYIASKISIWHFFSIPQANYLALDKNEKARMFSDYYKNLVFKYFGGKKIYFFMLFGIFSGQYVMSVTFELFLVF